MTAQLLHAEVHPIGQLVRDGHIFPTEGDLMVHGVRVDGTLWQRVAESGAAS